MTTPVPGSKGPDSSDITKVIQNKEPGILQGRTLVSLESGNLNSIDFQTLVELSGIGSLPAAQTLKGSDPQAKTALSIMQENEEHALGLLEMGKRLTKGLEKFAKGSGKEEEVAEAYEAFAKETFDAFLAKATFTEMQKSFSAGTEELKKLLDKEVGGIDVWMDNKGKGRTSKEIKALLDKVRNQYGLEIGNMVLALSTGETTKEQWSALHKNPLLERFLLREVGYPNFSEWMLSADRDRNDYIALLSQTQSFSGLEFSPGVEIVFSELGDLLRTDDRSFLKTDELFEILKTRTSSPECKVELFKLYSHRLKMQATDALHFPCALLAQGMNMRGKIVYKSHKGSQAFFKPEILQEALLKGSWPFGYETAIKVFIKIKGLKLRTTPREFIEDLVKVQTEDHFKALCGELGQSPEAVQKVLLSLLPSVLRCFTGKAQESTKEKLKVYEVTESSSEAEHAASVFKEMEPTVQGMPSYLEAL